MEFFCIGYGKPGSKNQDDVPADRHLVPVFGWGDRGQALLCPRCRTRLRVYRRRLVRTDPAAGHLT